MFESIANILQKGRHLRVRPNEFEIHAMPVYVTQDVTQEQWLSWQETLNEWLTKMDDAGWLDGLKQIEIGEDLMLMEQDGTHAQYRNLNKTVTLNAKRCNNHNGSLVAVGRPYMLLHETIHHVHIRDAVGGKVSRARIDELNESADFDDRRRHFKHHVSDYASSSVLEAVAETGAGLSLGEEYPAYIVETYTELGGPEPL